MKNQHQNSGNLTKAGVYFSEERLTKFVCEDSCCYVTIECQPENMSGISTNEFTNCNVTFVKLFHATFDHKMCFRTRLTCTQASNRISFNSGKNHVEM